MEERMSPQQRADAQRLAYEWDDGQQQKTVLLEVVFWRGESESVSPKKCRSTSVATRRAVQRDGIPMSL